MATIKAPYNGQLYINEVTSAIFNMIISQQVFANNIKGGTGLAEKYRVDGTLHGDTKLFYSTNCLESHPWGNYDEAANLLEVEKPASPKCQAITIDTWRQIRITLDNYLSKRAWSTEGTFSSFRSVMLGWMGKTKSVLDNTMINVYIGNNTTKTESGDDAYEPITDFTVALAANPTSAADYQLRAMKIAEELANIFTLLKDYNTSFNGYGFLRNYEPGEFDVVFSAKYINQIRNVDLPTIFDNQGLKGVFDKTVLPSKYFGRPVAATDKGSGKIIGTDGVIDNTKAVNGEYVHTLVEKSFILAGNKVHLFPGDKLPDGTQVGGTGHPDFAETEVYMEDSKCICKIVHKDAVKFMSAFLVETEFFNARSLTDSHYLTWGYGLDSLIEFPILKLSETNA